MYGKVKRDRKRRKEMERKVRKMGFGEGMKKKVMINTV